MTTSMDVQKKAEWLVIIEGLWGQHFDALRFLPEQQYQQGRQEFIDYIKSRASDWGFSDEEIDQAIEDIVHD